MNTSTPTTTVTESSITIQSSADYIFLADSKNCLNKLSIDRKGFCSTYLDEQKNNLVITFNSHLIMPKNVYNNAMVSVFIEKSNDGFTAEIIDIEHIYVNDFMHLFPHIEDLIINSPELIDLSKELAELAS
jgi:hypothetical protein